MRWWMLGVVCGLGVGCDDAPSTGGDMAVTAGDADMAMEAPGDMGLADAGPRGQPNLVLVVLDDVGAEVVEPWATAVGASGAVATTPTLDGLAAAGITVTTAWATPTCSPTRAGLHLGLYPSHAGVLAPVARQTVLTPTSDTLPRRLIAAGYRAGLFGKWHLGGGVTAPVTRGGWQAYRGQPDGALDDYFAWDHTVVDEAGEALTAPVTTYATSQVVDDALSWLGEQPADQPWVVMLAFNAPHAPFHLPPAALRPGVPDAALDADGDGVCDDEGDCYRAAIQALDTELGRFLAATDGLDGDRDTVVVALGDNGTPGQVVQAPYSRPHAKGTLYEGGVRVPLWISGPPSQVRARGAAAGLAHAGVDVFATLLELGGAEVPAGVDGVSLLPLLDDPAAEVRSTLYTDGEVGAEPALAAVLRDATHKVQVFDVTGDAYGCFDLGADPDEQTDLVASGAPPPVCAELLDALQAVR